jgi:glycosyltransferase involved in cell wall biosynthesis
LTIVSALDSAGGRSLIHRSICKGLVDAGHEVVVASRHPGDLEGEWSSIGTRVHQFDGYGRLQRRHPARSGRVVTGLALTMRSFRPELVYVPERALVATAWYAALASRVPLAIHLHDPARALDIQDRAAFRMARVIIAVSHACATDWANAGVPRRTLKVIHNGVDLDRFRPARASVTTDKPAQTPGLRRPKVLFVGRLDRSKGIDIFVAVAKELARDFDFVAIGDGESRHEMERSAGTAVRWVGWVDPASALRDADVLVVPSQYPDPLPTVALEALASGVPVVASRTGGLPEIVAAASDCILVSRELPSAFVEAVRTLAVWRAKDPKIAMRCRQAAVNHFSRERMVREVQNALVGCA